MDGQGLSEDPSHLRSFLSHSLPTRIFSSLCQESSHEALVEPASESPRPALARSASSDTSEEVSWPHGGWFREAISRLLWFPAH